MCPQAAFGKVDEENLSAKVTDSGEVAMKHFRQRSFAAGMAIFYSLWAVPPTRGYAFNEIVPDVRQSVSFSGGSACPVPSHMHTAAGAVAIRWSTALSSNPVTIITQDQSAAGRLNEIADLITRSLGTWTGVGGTTLQPRTIAALARTETQNACGSDGVNSICFDQVDLAFTPGVLAFTRVITADKIGVQIGSGSPATDIGEILDADIYFNPSDSRVTYATPSALPSNPSSYDLQSLLTHELGHAFGFSHSAVWNAIMFPFAPTVGTFSGTRPTEQQPDAMLGEDDRAGLRVLYPDFLDTLHSGSIRGRILPANPLSLPASPPNVTGLFGAHVVAVNAESGGVVGATFGGWTCSEAGPAQFDGSYTLQRLAIGHHYLIYAEPLNGAVDPSQISNATESLCRNSATDAGWPAAQSCVVPPVIISFTVRTRPGD